MEAANELMDRKAYGMAVLFGIGDFYDKFGYITCMPEHTFTMEARDAKRGESRLRSRIATEADYPGIARIYNRDNATLTGTCTRNALQWAGFAMGSGWMRKVSARVVLDQRGRIIGYVAFDNETDKCCASEVGGKDVRAFEIILGILASRAIKLRRKEISFKLPIDHPFSRWARQFGLSDVTAYPRNKDAMGRITNLSVCFQSLSEELSARSSGFSGLSDFRLATDIGSLRLTRRRGKLSIRETVSGLPTVRINQNYLTQLLMGYKSPADLINAGTMKAPRRIHPFLETLFPLQTAHVWWSDRF